MDINAVKDCLAEKFADKISWTSQEDMPTAVIQASENLNIIKYLYEEDALSFRFLTDVTAIHYPERVGEELCVVYHLHNLYANIRIRLKAYLSIDMPHIESVVSVFSGADWQEREAYDFFGVIFDNHPNLKRIMNVEEMDYHPMRKEFPMEDPTRMDKDDEMFGRGGSF